MNIERSLNRINKFIRTQGKRKEEESEDITLSIDRSTTACYVHTRKIRQIRKKR